jgi:LPXTG-motif cell wall-anchored protein
MLSRVRSSNVLAQELLSMLTLGDRGFYCTNLNGNTCVSLVSKTATLTTATCDSGWPQPERATITPFVVTDDDGKTTDVTVSLLAPMFQLNFKASDLATASETSSTSRQTSSTESTDSSRETGANSSDPSKDPTPSDGGGLSTGAQAGIGVGAAAIALLLIGLAWFFFRRRRARETQAADEMAAYAAGAPPPKYMAGQTPLRAELLGAQPGTNYELQGTQRPAELD